MRLQPLIFRTIGASLNALSIPFPRLAGNQAFQLFARPPKPRIQPKEAAFLATAKRLDIQFEGKNIAVFEWDAEGGQKVDLRSSQANTSAAKPFVFLAYGWGYNSGRWRYYVSPLLEAGFRVIGYDPPGHGYSEPGLLTYPIAVRLQKQLLARFGRPDLFLGHSFGAGCFVGTLRELPIELQPPRICLMGAFSDARFIFHNYRNALGLNRRTYVELTRAIYRRSGHPLSFFDNAAFANRMDHIECLFVHDPEDKVTAFSNALRNHGYWKGSYLHRAVGAGHHLGTAQVTRVVMEWLTKGKAPAEASKSKGLVDGEHDLRRFFRSLEQDTVHGKMESAYFM